jgi:hypothetical protein
MGAGSLAGIGFDSEPKAFTLRPANATEFRVL